MELLWDTGTRGIRMWPKHCKWHHIHYTLHTNRYSNSMDWTSNIWPRYLPSNIVENTAHLQVTTWKPCRYLLEGWWAYIFKSFIVNLMYLPFFPGCMYFGCVQTWWFLGVMVIEEMMIFRVISVVYTGNIITLLVSLWNILSFNIDMALLGGTCG